MHPEIIKRIDNLYVQFPEMRPQVVEKLLHTPNAYIHRQPISELQGVDKTDKRYLLLCNSRTNLYTWLTEYYHPAFAFQKIQQNRRTITRGHVEMFHISMSESPNVFSGPKCPLALVYHCAAAFTYDWMSANPTIPITEADKYISRIKWDSRDSHDRDCMEMANALLDQKMLRRHKSIPIMIDHLTEYITLKAAAL